MKQMAYVVVWSGGYDLPSMFASPDRDIAYRRFKEWSGKADETDTVMIVALHENYSLDMLEVE